MTENLKRAVLIRLIRKGKGPGGEPLLVPDKDGDFDVQFNPTSLRVTQTNDIDEGGATTQTQHRQNPSTQSATLNFDLEFDTAEETGADGPVDVRTRTAIIRQFASPSSDAPKQPPPILRFRWGSFSFVGIVKQLVEDLDYFSANGRPLRAKVAVTMKEVRPDLEAKLVGAPARTGQNATPPGTANPVGGAPGTDPPPNPDTVVRAKLGDSVQQVLARENEDPAAWRAAMNDLPSPLNLAAGAQVQIAAGATASLGVGASAGFAAGGSVGGTASLAGALGVSGVGGGTSAGVNARVIAGVSGGVDVGGGLTASAGLGAAATVDARANGGFALAEGGGVAASARLVATAAATASVTAARGAFEVPPIRVSGGVTGPGRPFAPTVDRRTQTFGRGVPLTARVTVTGT